MISPKIEFLVQDFHAIQCKLSELDSRIGDLSQSLFNVNTELKGCYRRHSEAMTDCQSIKERIKHRKKIQPINKLYTHLDNKNIEDAADRLALTQLDCEVKRLEISASKLEKDIRKLETRLARHNESKECLQHVAQDLEKRIEEVMQEPGQRRKTKILQRPILHLIFPATDVFSRDRLESLDSQAKDLEENPLIHAQMLVKNNRVLVVWNGRLAERNFIYEVGQDHAQRIEFYTRDHVRLDGCIVYADNTQIDITEKKMMVMVQGNNTTWQMGYAHAQEMARKYGCNVLIYNPRGVGASTGKTELLKEAIIDCCAAISFALVEACKGDPKRLAVYGHSLGGGITARALQIMVMDHSIGEGGIGLYINHHSFSCLSAVAKNYYRYGSIFGALTRGILSTAGQSNLKVKSVLVETRLADSVVIVSAENDEIIRRAAQLGRSLQQTRRAIANNILYITTPYGHNKEIEYLQEHVPLIDYDPSSSSSLSSSSLSSSSSSPCPASISNSSMGAAEAVPSQKEIQLDAYHKAIFDWVRQPSKSEDIPEGAASSS